MNLRDIEDFKLSDAVKFHDTLNPALFSDDKMHANVRDRMLEIAQDFIDHLGVDDIKVKDITLSGSNAAYTYTPHSDIDIHLIVDMDQFSNDEVYRELFNSKKVLYNDNHDIKIHGYDVELYVQDSAQPVRSLGEYSIKNDRWIKFPGKIRAELDQHSVAEKFKKLVQLSQMALFTNNTHSIDNLLQTLKRYRQAGLDEHGEFGPENLAYKALRSQGIIQKLYDQRDRIHSRNLSLDESEDDEYAPPGASLRDVMRIKRQISKQIPKKLVAVRSQDIGGSFTDAQLQAYGLRKNQSTGKWTGTQDQWDRFNRSRGLRESRSLLDKPTLTPQQIMRKHGVSYEQLIDQLTQGVKVELEHTNDSEVAYKIALAHLAEDPDYYTKLAKVGLEENGNQGVDDSLLNEIYKMPPTSMNSQGMAIWAYNDALEKKTPVVFKDNNVIIFKANEDLLRYIVLQDGNPVLYLGLRKFLDGYKSGTVATEMEGRGKGLAQKAYLNASDILGVPIYSDSTQTDASRLGIWGKLIQQYPDRIVGYDQKINKNLPLSMTDMGPTVNQNQPIYVDRNKKDSSKPLAPNQRYSTRLLKLLPSKKQGVAEALDKPYTLTWEPGDFGDEDAYARLPDGSYLSIMFNKGYNKANEEAWNVEFWRNNSQEISGQGDEFRIFATVLDAIKEFIRKPEHDPNIIIFSASKKVDPGQKQQSRAGLYDSLVERYARALGFTASRIDTGNKVIYEFSRIKKSVTEASGYIPSEKEKNDPRFKTALTVDVKPDSIKQNAKKLGLGRIQRAGIPPTARSDGKI